MHNDNDPRLTSDLEKEQILAEAMAFLKEQERLEEEARQKAEIERRAKANEPVSEQSYAEQYASGFICDRIYSSLRMTICV